MSATPRLTRPASPTRVTRPARRFAGAGVARWSRDTPAYRRGRPASPSRSVGPTRPTPSSQGRTW
ncbi:hypothetical protein [Frankia sp. AgKG'84/4]